MSYQDLHYLILKLLTRNFGFSRYNMALGVKALGLEEKVSMHSSLLMITVSTFKWSKKGSFCLSLLIFLQKRAERLKKIGILSKVITGGAII